MNISLNEEKKNNILAYFLLILTSLIWGGTWPVGRWLVAEKVGGVVIPPLMIAVIRYFLAVLSFLLLLKYREGSLNFEFARKNWKILAFMGLMSVTVYQSGYLFGEIFTAASDASIVVATNAFWVIILSSIFLKTEKFSWRKLIGTLMAFFSVVLVVGFSPNIDVTNRILGDIFVLMAAFAYAIYSVTSRYFMNKTKQDEEEFQPSSLWLITWISIFGFIITAPIGFIISPQFLNPLKYLTIPISIWLGIGYLAFFSTVGAYTFYLEGIKRLDASRAAIFQTLVPLFGVILSAIFLQEKFDFLIYPLSLLLVISGIILVNYNRSKVLKNKINEDN